MNDQYLTDSVLVFIDFMNAIHEDSQDVPVQESALAVWSEEGLVSRGRFPLSQVPHPFVREVKHVIEFPVPSSDSRIEIFFRRKNFPESFPFDIFTKYVKAEEFDCLFFFDSEYRELLLGKFFKRPCPLRDELEALLQRNRYPFLTDSLGDEIWKVIVKHGGVSCLEKIFRETLELDVFYEMKLKDPYCLDCLDE